MVTHPADGAWNRAIVLLLTLVLVLLLIGQRPFQANPQSTESAPDPAPDPYAAEQVEALVPSPSPAIHVSIWWDPQIAHRDLTLVQEMGFHWIKQKFPWREIQGAGPGEYDWYRTDRIVESAEAFGLNLIVRLDHQPFWSQPDGGAVPLNNAPPADLTDFEDFCFAVADRYQGRIKAYQVWNEPNLAREWGEQPPSPEGYVELLAHCARGIRRGDPEAIVISAGLAPTGTGLPVAMPDTEFLRRMYEAGAGQHFDMLGVNAPGYAAPPQADPQVVAQTPEWGGHEWNAFRHVENIRRIMVDYGDASKQIAILEMGWTTDPINPDYSWFAVTEEQQAEYLAGAYWWARQHWQPWIGLMTAIYIPDPAWTPMDEQYWWSITLPDWPETRVRPAYEALKGLPDWGSPNDSITDR
ncbi:MAG: hypothetical protein Kow00124_07010 [Anaerolineae bacterium]